MPPNMKKLKKQREDAKKRAAARAKEVKGSKLISKKTIARTPTPLAGKSGARRISTVHVYGDPVKKKKTTTTSKPKPGAAQRTKPAGTNKPPKKKTVLTRRGERPVVKKKGPSNSGKYDSLAKRRKRRKK